MRTTRYGSGGPPLVLVHGLACDGSDWAAQVAVFEPRTTVIVCELPGHGSSPAIPADCTVGAYGAALVRDLIEQAVGRRFWWATAWGAGSLWRRTGSNPPSPPDWCSSTAAGSDAGEVEVALDCIAVPLLAIQTTTMDTARQRASLQPGESSPWLDLIRAHVPHAAITTLFGSGHFPQIERSQEITELIACFAQL